MEPTSYGTEGVPAILSARSNQAFDFDGSSWVALPQADVGLYSRAQSTGVTLSMWVRAAAQDENYFFSEGNSSTNTPIYGVQTGDTGAATGDQIRFAHRPSDGAPLTLVASDGSYFSGTPAYRHIAFTDNAGDVTVYVDGVADTANFDYVPEPTATNRTAIGALDRLSACCEFTGQIDEVAVYNQVLTPTQVNALATGADPATLVAGPSAPLPSETVAYESFGYASGGNLAGNGPGNVGFNGTWGDTSLPADTDWDVTAGSLSYPSGVSLAPAGNAAQLDGTAGDGGDISQRLSTTIDFDTNGTHYFSFLLNKTDNATSSDFFWAMLRDDSQTGLDMKAAIGSASGDVPILGLNQTTNNLLGSDDLLAGDILFVGRIDTAATGDDDLFLSTFGATDSVPLIEPAWDIQFSDTVTGIADTLNLSGGANTIVTFDEFRLGTTFASVTQAAVPEPSSFSVYSVTFALFWLGVAVRRFRMR